MRQKDRTMYFTEDMLTYFANERQELVNDFGYDEEDEDNNLQKLYDILQLSQMTKIQYVCIKLAKFGMKHREIAEVMGTTENAVYRNICRGRDKQGIIEQSLRDLIEVENTIQDLKVKFFNRADRKDIIE